MLSLSGIRAAPAGGRARSREPANLVSELTQPPKYSAPRADTGVLITANRLQDIYLTSNQTIFYESDRRCHSDLFYKKFGCLVICWVVSYTRN